MRILQRQGIVIARRTIAKYREELQILPSRLRRMRTANAAKSTPAAMPVEAMPVGAMAVAAV
jgi:hypothetical protein